MAEDAVLVAQRAFDEDPNTPAKEKLLHTQRQGTKELEAEARSVLLLSLLCSQLITNP